MSNPNFRGKTITESGVIRTWQNKIFVGERKVDIRSLLFASVRKDNILIMNSKPIAILNYIKSFACAAYGI